MSDALVNGLAGACGGIIAQVLTYPLQAVNTRQQVRRQVLNPPAAYDAEVALQNTGEYNAELDAHQRDDAAERREPREIVSSPVLPGTSRHDGASALARQPGPKPAAAGPLTGSVAETMREMWEIICTEGLGSLYRGLEPSLVGTACSQGVYYYFYQLLRDRAESLASRRKLRGLGNGQVGMGMSLIVAALAGCANVLLTNPIWVIVTRMQTQSKAAAAAAAVAAAAGSGAALVPAPPPAPVGNQGSGGSPGSADLSAALLDDGSSRRGALTSVPKASSSASSVPPAPKPLGALATTLELFEEAGLLGFWKGVLPTLIMVCNPAIQFSIYETLMARLTANRAKKRGGATSASAWEIFLVGAIAKLGATVVTYPLLVVKARLQARSSDTAARYSGTLDALARIVVEEGMAGLYKGMETKIVQSVFAASVLFLTKEEMVKLVRFLLERHERGGGPLRIRSPPSVLPAPSTALEGSRLTDE